LRGCSVPSVVLFYLVENLQYLTSYLKLVMVSPKVLPSDGTIFFRQRFCTFCNVPEVIFVVYHVLELRRQENDEGF
jgi:hypothetical protein